MSNPITRRDFMRSSALAAAGALYPASQALATPQSEPASASTDSTTLPKGKILTFGMHCDNFNGAHQGIVAKRGMHSILTEIDIRTGSTKSTALEMRGEGHMAMGVGDGRILCTGHHQSLSMMIDANHNVLKTYTAPEGYVYGGHGLILEEKGVFILPARAKKASSVQDTGLLQVYDLKTMDLLDQLSSGGVHPHEPHVIPGKNEIAVTHYGDIYPVAMPMEHDVQDGKLTIYDAQTLKVKRHYDQNDLKAMTTHMQVDGQGMAYFVLTQYIKFDWNKANRNGSVSFDALWQDAEIALEQWTGRKRDYHHSYLSHSENRLAVPLPLVKVDTQTGERELIFDEPGNHLRGQTVGHNSLTDTILATFYHSDMLLMAKTGAGHEWVTGAQLGITDLRGVTDIPGTALVALHGSERNAVLFDVTTKEVVQRYRCENFYSVHCGYSAV